MAWTSLSADSSREIEESLEAVKELEAFSSLVKLRWPFVVVADGQQPSPQRPARVRVSTSAAKPALTEIVRWASREISASE